MMFTIQNSFLPLVMNPQQKNQFTNITQLVLQLNKPKMKLKRKGLLFFIVAFFVLLVIARLTGAYVFYTIPTGSMEPTLPVGKKILATNLKGPKRNNIILFTRTVNERFENDPSGKTSTFCSRLIAMGGDTLQVKNGYAYINGELADDSAQL